MKDHNEVDDDKGSEFDESRITPELLKDLANRSEEAFEVVYNTYNGMVYYMIYLTVRNREASCDLAQDTFINMWHCLAPITSPKLFKQWLLNIAKKMALDYSRKTVGYVKNFDEEHYCNGIDENRIFDMKLDFKAVLTVKEYSIVTLRIIYGLDFKMISEQLGWPKSTIHSAYERGIAKLRAYYGGDDD